MLTNTLVKDIKAVIVLDDEMLQEDIVVRFTSDKLGETLSFEYENIMICVEYEKIIKIIDKARSNRWLIT